MDGQIFNALRKYFGNFHWSGRMRTEMVHKQYVIFVKANVDCLKQYISK